MTPYLRSHRRQMVIHRLSDWELWYLMRSMPDQELVNFSSACHRFRTIATTLLTYRAELKPYTNVVFTSQTGCCTSRIGPNGKPYWWLHPIQIINSIEQSPQVASYIRTIDTVILRNYSIDWCPPCVSCHGKTTIGQLQASGDMTALVSRLSFLSPQRRNVWVQAIRMLSLPPAFLLLIFLCPNLESITIRGVAHDVSFDQYINDISPAMLPLSGVNNTGGTIPLVMPAIKTVNLVGHSHWARTAITFFTVLQFSHIPGLHTLNCANVIDSPLRQPFWPSRRLSSVEHVALLESLIHESTLLDLIRNLPNLKELTYSEQRWYYGGHLTSRAVTSPRQYHKSLSSNGHDLLEDRRLKVVRIEWTENLGPSSGNDNSGQDPGNTVRKRAVKVVPKYKR